MSKQKNQPPQWCTEVQFYILYSTFTFDLRSPRCTFLFCWAYHDIELLFPSETPPSSLLIAHKILSNSNAMITWSWGLPHVAPIRVLFVISSVKLGWLHRIPMKQNIFAFIYNMDVKYFFSYFNTILIQIWFPHPNFHNLWLTYGFFIQKFLKFLHLS